jgi:hypothetical protein
MSLLDKAVNPVAFALQQPNCMPPQSGQCGLVYYDPKTYRCCTSPAGGKCVIDKIPADQDCGAVWGLYTVPVNTQLLIPPNVLHQCKQQDFELNGRH